MKRIPPSSLLTAILLALMLTFFGLETSPALAQTSEGSPTPTPPVYNSDGKGCLTCHEQPDLATTMGNGEIFPLFLDVHKYTNSVHGSRGLTCQDCHSAGPASLPDHPQSIVCADCHLDGGDDEVPPLGLLGHLPSNSIWEYRQESEVLCIRCHINQAAVNADQLHAEVDAQSKEPAPLCSDCHVAHETKPELPPFAETSTQCLSCHRRLYSEGLLRIHGHAELGGAVREPDSPTCVQCHQVHGTDAPARPVTVWEGIQTSCTNCHSDQGIPGGFTLSADILQPQIPEFSGKVTVIASPIHNVAVTRTRVRQTCESCHGPIDLSFDAPRQLPLSTPVLQASERTWSQTASLGLLLISVAALLVFIGQDSLKKLRQWRKEK